MSSCIYFPPEIEIIPGFPGRFHLPAGRRAELLSRKDQPGRENAELRDRLARLSAAILRISASLELDAVLREVVDSARALTGARCGVIATVDEAGQPQDFVSSGLSPLEHRQLVEWPDGHRLFEHLRNLPGALRLSDLNRYVRSLGFSSRATADQNLQNLSGYSDAASGSGGRPLLPRRQGGGRRLHRGRRRNPVAVRLAGGHGDRQRPHAPQGAAGAGRTWRP